MSPAEGPAGPDAERLIAERQRLLQVFELVPACMALLRGPGHRIEFANAACRALAGGDALVGRGAAEIGAGLFGPDLVAHLDAVRASGEPQSVPGVRRGAPGTGQVIDFSYRPLLAADGTVDGVLIEGTDVTTRVAAEEAAQSGEARNRQIVDSAIDFAIIAFDLEGRVTRWNTGAERILGWSEAEMLGHTAARIFTPEDQRNHRMESEMGQALVAGVGQDDRWHMRKSGERFWASGEMTPLKETAGTVAGFVKVLRDRTEQHVAEQKLLRLEQRLRRAQEAGGVGIFSLDLDTDLLTGSAEFCRIYGIEPCETIPSAELEALVVREDAGIRSSKASRRNQSAALDVEYRIRRRDDGALRWIARRAEFVRDAAGTPLRLDGVVQDVTARKESQREIEQGATQFYTFAQSLPHQAWTATPEGRIDWFNDRVYEDIGAAPGSLDSEAWADTLHEDDRAPTIARWQASLASGTPYHTEFRVRTASGGHRWYLARALPVRDPEGRIVRWVGTNTDIHVRKLAETEVNRDRDRIWNSTSDLMGTAGQDGYLKSINPAWGRLLGYDDAELLDRPFFEIVEPGDHAVVAAAMQRLAAGEKVSNLEDRLIHKDGQRSLISWSAEPVGDVFHIVGRNVTELRHTEDALRQAQKMEAVGQLTGGIAHDFNNLLQGITGSLDIMQRRLSLGRVAELDRFITGAMTSANRAAALTHRLLAFSRRQPLDPRPLRANPLLASMEELMRRTLGERIELEIVLAGGLWLTRCDANQLESAILNLVINARDAMPGGGKLTIETCNAHLDNAYVARSRDVRPGQYICICVTDTGTGMSADTIAKAFEPFFTTKPIGQGTGLGLSMIYGFARQSEGYAKIYSELGQGTTFKLYLPRHRGSDTDEESELPIVPEAQGAAAEETVLVIEDEPVVRSLVVEVLQELGYRALEAGDGPSGLAVLRTEQRIDLVVTDVGLPGLNGRQVADAGRELRPGLKVLFMTGYAENAALASGFLEPGMAMITKPFAMDVLAARVREMLQPR